MYYKSKAERQKRWRSLTTEQQFGYVESLVAKKAVRRRKEALRTMKKYGDKFSCVTCFHRTTDSCDDDLPNGCGYWFSPDAKKQGPKLESQHSKNLAR